MIHQPSLLDGLCKFIPVIFRDMWCIHKETECIMDVVILLSCVDCPLRMKWIAWNARKGKLTKIKLTMSPTSANFCSMTSADGTTTSPGLAWFLVSSGPRMIQWLNRVASMLQEGKKLYGSTSPQACTKKCLQMLIPAFIQSLQSQIIWWLYVW